MSRAAGLGMAGVAVLVAVVGCWPLTDREARASAGPALASVVTTGSPRLPATSAPAGPAAAVDRTASAPAPHAVTAAPTIAAPLRTSLDTLYARARGPGQRGDRLLATHMAFVCADVAHARMALLEEPDRESGQALRLGGDAFAAMRAANAAFSRYCDAYRGEPYLSEGQVDRAYLHQSNPSRPFAERFPLQVNALSAPAGHPIEFVLWLETDLRGILEKRFGLDWPLALHAQVLVLERFILDPELRHSHRLRLCAARFYCEGVTALSDAERTTARQAADAIEQLIAQQRWEHLVAPRS